MLVVGCWLLVVGLCGLSYWLLAFGRWRWSARYKQRRPTKFDYCETSAKSQEPEPKAVLVDWLMVPDSNRDRLETVIANEAIARAQGEAIPVQRQGNDKGEKLTDEAETVPAPA